MDREFGIASQIANDIVKGAARKCNDCPAFRADQVMAMSGLADDIRGMTARLKQPRQHIDGSKDLERAINRGSSDLWHLGDELLSSKWSFATKNRAHNSAPWRRHPVTMFKEERIDIRRPKRRQSRIHVKRVA